MKNMSDADKNYVFRQNLPWLMFYLVLFLACIFRQDLVDEVEHFVGTPGVTHEVKPSAYTEYSYVPTSEPAGRR